MRADDHINYLQFLPLVAGSFMALGLFQFPRDAVALAGREASLAILLGFLWTLLGGYFAYRLGTLYPGRLFSDYLQEVYGRFIGKILLALSIAFFVQVAFFALRSLGEIMTTLFMPSTPIYGVIAIILLAALYANLGGLAEVSRVTWVVYGATALVYAVALSLTLSRVEEPLALSPGWPWHPLAIVRAAYRSDYVYAGHVAALQFFPFLRSNRPRLTLLYLYAGYTIDAFLIFLAYFGAMGSLGPAATGYFTWPVVTSLRFVVFPGFFVDRVGYLVILGLSGFVFAFLVIWIRAVAMAASDLLDRRLAVHPLVFVAALLILIGSLYPSSEAELERLMRHNLLPFLIIFNFGLLPLTLLLALWQRRRKKTPTGGPGKSQPMPEIR